MARKERGVGVWDVAAGRWLTDAEADAFIERLQPGTVTVRAGLKRRRAAAAWLELLVGLADAPPINVGYDPDRISTGRLKELAARLVELAPVYEDQALAVHEACLGDLQATVRRYLDDEEYRRHIERLGRRYADMVPQLEEAMRQAWNGEFLLAIFTSARGFSEPLRHCDYCGRLYAKKRDDQLHCRTMCTRNHWIKKQPVERQRKWKRDTQARWRAKKKKED